MECARGGCNRPQPRDLDAAGSAQRRLALATTSAAGDEYVGSLSRFMHVPLVGSRSASRAMGTLCTHSGGFSWRNPRNGGREQLVTKRSKSARCCLLNDSTTAQNACTYGWLSW